MRPAISILQLDTHFPRIAGDVGCVDTYAEPVEIIRIAKATVAGIVTNRPDLIDITPFETAVKQASGDVIVTSCGFLSYWQNHLAALTPKPFISSALMGLNDLAKQYRAGEVLILTFDADSLTSAHLGTHTGYAKGIVGLPKTAHLRHVITANAPDLNADLARAEVVQTVRDNLRPQHKHILLECTNLPPYKAALQDAFGLPVTDILTLISAVKPDAVRPEFRSDCDQLIHCPPSTL